MAKTLKEIAPDVQIYALGTAVNRSEKTFVETISVAIDWAISKKIDILTYSQPFISNENREMFDQSIQRAHNAGIVTTFIHCDEPDNLLPDGLYDEKEEELSRRSRHGCNAERDQPYACSGSI